MTVYSKLTTSSQAYLLRHKKRQIKTSRIVILQKQIKTATAWDLTGSITPRTQAHQSLIFG